MTKPKPKPKRKATVPPKKKPVASDGFVEASDAVRKLFHIPDGTPMRCSPKAMKKLIDKGLIPHTEDTA